ncbi:unnamed protein product [Darwinula stevensoni]|uniref:Uncharacterized protein n=1 Tax=Darwinula stevensoni TaxID=69355 RepID=A0A7R8WZS6_9CRUS|nr:unnamed protein product [Darwinula stevensoni]CAG0880364.1 unnamed protein product [Darwinula stevensoni]
MGMLLTFNAATIALIIVGMRDRSESIVGGVVSAAPLRRHPDRGISVGGVAHGIITGTGIEIIITAPNVAITGIPPPRSRVCHLSNPLPALTSLPPPTPPPSSPPPPPPILSSPLLSA